MITQNPNCDGAHCRQATGEVRMLPTSAGPEGSNAILCATCFDHEILWRAERNRKLEPQNRFPLPSWKELKVYGKSNEDWDDAFGEFFKHCLEITNDHRGPEGYEDEPMSYRDGKRYRKLVFRGAAWAFVEFETGLIYKPASWSRPAPHARGCIFDDDYGASCVSWTGPHYLR